MKATRAVMGGGRRFFHPRYVWSPAGGYWNDGSAAAAGRKWLLFGGAGMLIFAVSRYSSSHEKLRNPDGQDMVPSALLRTRDAPERQ
ncbi:hypothetical protein FNF27_01732 [Cafeteria roenbergensis]|uniref:Uncharacterized protein n=1 Tax=Cafeteria roenbergensis TaxID=33653 RepID=A0A5A8DAS0_CAFRO|nr:hypothetical protein FNF29_07349 [Cafeteria roenbergensis]KAA0162348.1 hypothetical protein FNF28_04767 [Cafeteria roenbergensis]KAA0167742.1 hypothetical protein FNF31_00677 [Cafeteria roenbergensis]KAA0176910.1 hypothetical protein FNF27_01732 [Cafeteria roenbergensis]|eukprot:KAA0147503.1 hypothetical protein FNF29_07349 [Cafeteria roenbergensis]